MLPNCPIACDDNKVNLKDHFINDKTNVMFLQDCTDLNVNCDYWGKKGECSKNAAYMNIYCYKTCRCSKVNDCTDDHENCAYWSGQGHCKQGGDYYAFMVAKCRRACNFCKK